MCRSKNEGSPHLIEVLLFVCTREDHEEHEVDGDSEAHVCGAGSGGQVTPRVPTAHQGITHAANFMCRVYDQHCRMQSVQFYVNVTFRVAI